MLPFPFIDSMLMFFIYAFIGWVVEVIYYGITEGRFINRGFLNGLVCPVYGIGFYAVICLLRPFVGNFPMLFFGSATICTTAELFAGVILYAIFHLRWWDYSEYKWNLKGFICLRFYLYWGLACSLGMYILHPAESYFLARMSDMLKFSLVVVLVILLVVDIIISTIDYIGLSKHIKALQKISTGLKWPSDKIGSQIYDTVDTLVTKANPAVSSYNEYMEMFNAHRAEEMELFKAHRDEELKLLGEFVSMGRKSIVESGKATGAKIGGGLSKALKAEKKVLQRIRLNRKDPNAEAIRMIKAGADIDMNGKEEKIKYEVNDSI